VYGSTLGLRRSTFESIGGFDEALAIAGGEDIDFCWRAQMQGATLAFVPEEVLLCRFPSTYAALFRQAATTAARRFA
jgi:GT2 family glycosyltransferase